MGEECGIRVRLLRGGAERLPAYQTDGSAGMDLSADLDGEMIIPPMGRAKIPTGIALSMPPGVEGQVRPRSGLAIRHGVTCLNSPGTIDPDYRGEVCVILVNFGEEPFPVRRGDRIAQIVFSRTVRARLEVVPDLEGTPRGTGGFGHTGR
ncbi:MAG TPA: dUTP diphosphatase [Candidatus Methylomirabilis sp.]|nr:dUTP diphosphatase [Candidatus Methylomirabilis sp.]